MNREIKKGDVVKLLNNNRYNQGLTEGKKYEVSNVLENGKLIQIRYSVYLIIVAKEDVELVDNPVIVEEKSTEEIISDNVNSPNHYTQGQYETIDVIEDIVEDFESYLLGNIIKYISRYKNKNGVQDLEKAEWYLKRLIKKEKNNE